MADDFFDQMHLPCGRIMLFDDADWWKLANLKSMFSVITAGKRNVYVRGIARDGTRLWVHRLIAETPDGYVTDHINGNGLDNRQRNLRICSAGMNGRNKRPKIGKFKGVSLHKPTGLFRATLMLDGRTVSGGYFKSEMEAAEAYDQLAIAHHGEFANTNFGGIQ